MSSLSHPDLDIQEHLPLQRLWWKIERVAWGVIALVLAAGLLGLFGGGLSQTTRSGDGILVRFDRVARRGATSELHVRAEPSEHGVIVCVSKSFFDALELEGVYPHPERWGVTDEEVVMKFALPAAGSAAHLRVEYRPKGGQLRGVVRVEGGGSVEVRQVVLP